MHSVQAFSPVPSPIPYLQTRFPDELLGSWLSRLVVLNAEPSFVAFARTLGISVNVKSPVADPLNGAEYVRSLAALLGMECETLIRESTTKAYWDAFASPRPMNGQRTRRRPTIARLSPPVLRVCPECIEVDLVRMGAHYFHRTHQLRSKACPHHTLMLQDSCGACGQTFCSSHQPSLLYSRCSCGEALIETLKRVPASPEWHALAKFSHQTLLAAPGTLDLEFLVPFAVDRAVERWNLSISRSLQRTLVDAYGLDGLDWLCRRPGDQAISITSRERQLSTSDLPPQLAAAVLTSCGITFEEAKAAVATQKTLSPSERTIPRGSRGPRKHFVPTDLLEAKRMAEEYLVEATHRGKLRVYRPFVFWMLYLLDKPWLSNLLVCDENPIQAVLKVAPTLEQDRLTIMARGPTLERQMARARAFTRDRVWLEKKDEKRTQAMDRSSLILEALVTARIEHCASGSRPTKWTVVAAAMRLRIPDATLSNLATVDSRFRLVVPESPCEYMVRLIDWSIAECIDRGKNPTFTNIRRVGSFRYDSKSKLLMSERLAKRRQGWGPTQDDRIRSEFAHP